MDWDTVKKNFEGNDEIQPESDNNIEHQSIVSKDIQMLLEKTKLPFETTDEFINRLIRLQHSYYSKRGKELIGTIFNDVFLQCSGDYFIQYETHVKKEKIKESMRKQIRNSIYDLFKESDDNILTLLLLIDETITLLLQTDFGEVLAKEKQQMQ
jgi:hypothetical protein